MVTAAVHLCLFVLGVGFGKKQDLLFLCLEFFWVVEGLCLGLFIVADRAVMYLQCIYKKKEEGREESVISSYVLWHF